MYITACRVPPEHQALLVHQVLQDLQEILYVFKILKVTNCPVQNEINTYNNYYFKMCIPCSILIQGEAGIQGPTGTPGDPGEPVCCLHFRSLRATYDNNNI